MARWCLFNFFIKEICSTNNSLGHLLLKAINKKINMKKALLNYFDRFWIYTLDNRIQKLYIRVIAKFDDINP